MKSEIIKEIIKNNNGFVTNKDLKEHRIDSWYLKDLCNKGFIERVAKGIYFDFNYSGFDDLYILQLKYPYLVFSYQTALFLHDLSDRIPSVYEATVQRGKNYSSIKNVKINSTKREWFEIGVEKITTKSKRVINIYNMERTICDLIMDRNNQDHEIFSKALKFYLKKDNKNISRLRKYAKIFNISKKLEDIFEVLSDE